MSETLVRIGGAYCLAFAVFHLFFWRLFRWRRELAKLGFVNRQVVQILNLCLTFAFVVFAVPSLFFAGEMVGTGLGRTLLGLIALFWLLRAVEQVVFFGLRRWLSVVFFLTFLGGVALFAWPLAAGA